MSHLDPAQIRALVEHVPTLIWRAGVDAKREYFNPEWLSFTGRSRQQELGDGWIEGVHLDDLATCNATYSEHFELRQPFEIDYRLRRHDGVYRYVCERGTPYATNSEFAGFVGSCMDVDERRAHEVATTESEFFGISLDNLCVAGFDGFFKRVNFAWTRTLGWSAEELMSQPSLNFVHPDDRELTLAGRARLQSKLELGPLVNRYLCKDGTYRWFEWRSVVHHGRGLVYAAARDVTQQKLAEARLAEATTHQEKLKSQLILADRMASVGTLAAGVAHELNNPLTSVTGNVSLMLEELARMSAMNPTEQTTQLAELAVEAQAGAERIRSIVLGLKTFSRAEDERRQVIDLPTVLDLSIGMVFHEIRSRAALVKDYGETPRVDADQARLAQVFINVLLNAVQALPDEPAVAHEIHVATRTDTLGRAVVEIRDTGSGIAPALLDRVFEPFFTTKAVGRGTGLGLSICRNIVTGLGGEIAVASTQGRGTTFCITLLPATRAVRAAAVSSAPSPRPSASGLAVLVVDDEPAIGNLLRRVLDSHQVTTVTMAKQALELLRSGSDFDIIISDIMMPEVSGMAFYNELSVHFPTTIERVVFLTGGAATAETRAFFDRVPNEVIEKPCAPQKLRELVQRHYESCGRT